MYVEVKVLVLMLMLMFFPHHANKQSSLFEFNQDLVAGYKIRCNNHSELMETLKQVPFFIYLHGSHNLASFLAVVTLEINLL